MLASVKEVVETREGAATLEIYEVREHVCLAARRGAGGGTEC